MPCYKSLQCIERCYCYFVQPNHIHKGDTMSTKMENYQLHKGRIYSKAVLLDCTQYNIKGPLSVDSFLGGVSQLQCKTVEMQII